jgi:hypothetical protein
MSAINPIENSYSDFRNEFSENDPTNELLNDLYKDLPNDLFLQNENSSFKDAELIESFLKESSEKTFINEFNVPVDFDIQDGYLIKRTGAVDEFSMHNREQGEVPGFWGTCGINSILSFVRFLINPEESERDGLIKALNNHLCDSRGGTNEALRKSILAEYGLDSSIEYGSTIALLEKNIQEGKGVIAALNGHVLWDREFKDQGINPTPNHAVAITGAAHDGITGKLLGFYINDSQYGEEGAGKFIDIEKMKSAWEKFGGICNVIESSIYRK